MSTATVPATSAWAPFRQRAFRWLWLGVLISSVGSWAQTVGAQWLFVNDPNAATIVSLVQTANSLPAMLLALPAGVLADAFDRKWILFGVQVYAIAVSGLLAVLTALGLMPPILLLAFTFAVGAGLAILIPTWQPLISELVPRSQLAAATRLDMVSVNLSRAAGPAIAGVMISIAGVASVFAFNAACALPLVLILLAWRRQRLGTGPRERFLPALRAGGRYVRHEPVVRLIIVRLAMLVIPGSALWALLALIASRQLGLGASGYGLLFAALGIGAVVGALSAGWLQARLAANGTLTLAMGAFALALALVMIVPNLLLAFVLLVVAGFGWTCSASTLVSELQLFLPGWVRARALAVYMMVFMGTMALGAPVWGQVAQWFGLSVAIWSAAALVALAAVAGLALRLPENQHLDRSPAVYWGDAGALIDPSVETGPVAVTVEMTVAPEDEEAFLEAMQDMRRSRLRSGAVRWDLWRVAEQPNTFWEVFVVPSWDEHVRQHEVRLTAEDEAIEKRAFSLTSRAPVGRHLVPPDAPLQEPHEAGERPD